MCAHTQKDLGKSQFSVPEKGIQTIQKIEVADLSQRELEVYLKTDHQARHLFKKFLTIKCF